MLRHSAGMDRLSEGSIGGHSGNRWCAKHRRCCRTARVPGSPFAPHRSRRHTRPARKPQEPGKLGKTRVMAECDDRSRRRSERRIKAAGFRVRQTLAAKLVNELV